MTPKQLNALKSEFPRLTLWVGKTTAQVRTQVRGGRELGTFEFSDRARLFGCCREANINCFPA
jgi:hypothetical protein